MPSINGLFGMPARYSATLPTLADGAASALQIDNRGRLIVASDVSVAIEVGGQYNTTPPSLTNGQTSNLQLDSSGRLIVTFAPLSSSTDSVAVIGSPTGITAPGTALPVAVINGSGNLETLRSGFGDDNTGSIKAQLYGWNGGQAFRLRTAAVGDGLAGDTILVAQPFTYNGTNYDRSRSVLDATNSTGTGISAVGLVAQLDDTTPTTITENQFGNLRMTKARALMTESVYQFTRVTADAQIKGSAGFIHSVTIAPTGLPVTGALTIYDNTAESGTVIFSVQIPNSIFVPFTITFDVNTATGIYVGYDGSLTNTQVTVAYR